MRPESSSATTSSSTTPSPSRKRNRDPEDEVYVDNLHSHKRYLSEIMASSLNGLTVGDPLPEYLLESPARSEATFSPRDEMTWQYSPMSEDSDDSRLSETPMNTSFSHPDSRPTSPVSPYRYQRPLNAFCSTPPTSSHHLPGNVGAGTCSQPRKRGSDTEVRFPSSPSDIVHSSDLRRAALMRSVQMKTQSAGQSSLELQFGPGQEYPPSIEVEERRCSCVKSLIGDREYQIEECSSQGMSDPEFSQGKSCGVSNLNLKADESGN
ncbi:putative phosphoribosylamine-glycine ligase [Hibiscus syriacus]|uniref:Phosphoribosylamine-glycine ligase n=1 Tax=Hibiscus syriacus TaxID=106335 RepID=A0A6A2YQU8_HIBSY|nr:uncharacterized protein LOC120158361 [Hibiscus syriacus]KAE8681647.1 putative phosphoribosylamine-glycine ligase [Hibiscus syriacus]